MPHLVVGPPEWVPISRLALPDSPRLAGEDVEHTRILAESDTPLPPIIVHRRTMRIIDGMHRLNAAILNGKDRIEARFFDGSDSEAFLLAVGYNVAHGLPLSLADREAAATRIIEIYPHWSDRAIATVVGLAARTVRNVRRNLPEGAAAVDRRVGRDGRARPLNSANGRRVASEIIARRPEASLREIAQAANISPTTARDVRERMRRGEDPVLPQQRRNDRQSDSVAPLEASPHDPERQGFADELAATLRGLRNDPSLRLTESGRSFLRWLGPRASGPAGWGIVVPNVPPHSAYIVAKLARRCAEEWAAFADHLERRGAPPP